MKPDHIVGTHCTGFRAMVALNKEMPEEFSISRAGTKYTFGAYMLRSQYRKGKHDEKVN
jgi:hypothetical protein